MLKRVIKEEVKVPADIGYLGQMRDFVTRIGRKYGVSERTINAFKLAIDEAGTNIIRHAYRDWEGFITVQMVIRDQTVTITLIDQGHTFDPNNVRDPDLQRYVDIGKKGGLGVFIIRRVIDEIDYRKTENGNELRLTKKRDTSPRRNVFLADVSLTMKTRFSLIASGILSAVILAVFIWNYLRLDDKILDANFSATRAIARSMAKSCLDPLVEEETWELARIAAEIQREYSPLLMEALVVDTLEIVQGAYYTDNFLLMPYPEPSDVVMRDDGVREYSLPRLGHVFEITERIANEASIEGRPLGNVRLLIDRAFIQEEISEARIRAFWMSALALVAGYVGVFVLVYMTMVPFRRLSKWVRELGQGEVKDEIEFDTSDEVGEIAQAFNEITEKFRKSQESLAEQERLQKEMQVAQEIQHTLLPSAFPDIEGYEIASYYEAAKEVGGDYFDFVEVDKDTLGIVVADVSGKGVPGSLVMTMIRTALRTEARGNKDAADVLARVNDFVIKDMKRGMFVTIFYIILDSKNRTLNYASAGHNPMILYRGITNKSYYLNPRGFPIGISLPDNSLFRKSIESDTLKLQAGDVLIIYTDGITEAMNPVREKFSDERFLTTIRTFGHLQVDPLVDKIRDDINVFTEGFAQNDDITLVAIREKMSADEVLFNLRSRLMRMVNEEGMTVKDACKTVGVSTSTYYKYKKRFEKMGEEGLKDKIARSEIEERHISIEDKAKIYDIIREHPEYGAKRICTELNTEKYGFLEMDSRRLYEQLVRNRLNTKELRQAFIERGTHQKRMKPPGTPMLTLDGHVIMESKVVKKMEGQDVVSGTMEEEKKKAVGFRVSQQSDEIPVSESAPGEKLEKDSLLDSFLGFVEDEEGSKEDVEKHAEMDFQLDAQEAELVPSTEENASFSVLDEDFDIEHAAVDHEDDGLLEELGETGDDSLFSVLNRCVASEKEEDDTDDQDVTEAINEDVAAEIGEEFDDLIEGLTDVDVERIEQDLTYETDAQLERILDVDGSDFFDSREDVVEDRISTSIGDDLFENEMGLSEPGKEDLFSSTLKEIDHEEDEDDEVPALVGGDDHEKNESFQAGLQYYKKGQYSRAVSEFQNVLESYPDYVDASQCLGDSYFRMGRMDDARKAYERVRKMDPKNVSVLENMGVIFANQGDYKKAVWLWGEVLKSNPNRRDIIDRIKKMQRVIRQRYI